MADQYANMPPELHPANYVMKGNKPKIDAPCHDPAPEIDHTALEAMNRDQLLALIKKMPGYPVALMTREEQAEAMMTRLAIEALDPKGRQTLAAINAWLDREKGKAITPIAAQIKITDDRPVDKQRLARELAFLNAMLENAGDESQNGANTLEHVPNGE